MKFVAEIGSNHNADFDRALRLIEAAHGVGADAVKFQLFRADLLHRDQEARERARPRELPLEWIPLLQEKAHSLGMEFGLSAFYLGATKDADPDFWKIASYEANWWPLVDELGNLRKPLLVSIGLLDTREVEKLCGRCYKINQLILLHSVSLYPTPIEKANLSYIGVLKDFSEEVGYSDHTVRRECIERAVLYWGASYVEFHLDLGDAPGWEGALSLGWEAAHSYTPDLIAPCIALCRMDFAEQDMSERIHMRGKGGLRA